jgi:hypothetical protein
MPPLLDSNHSHLPTLKVDTYTLLSAYRRNFSSLVNRHKWGSLPEAEESKQPDETKTLSACSTICFRSFESAAELEI